MLSTTGLLALVLATSHTAKIERRSAASGQAESIWWPKSLGRRRRALGSAPLLYDAFISHASEDKEAFVRPLAERLRDAHIEVWYDEFSLRVGDGLRRSIDRGLAQSRFGIVVLSPNFFEKQWSQLELDGLVSRQMAGADNLILPIWLDLTRDDMVEYSPSLADKVALGADAGLDEVVRQLVEVIRPRGSTLVVARDYLIDGGFEPPVVTDDWWLDVAAAAESNDLEGGWQEAMG